MTAGSGVDEPSRLGALALYSILDTPPEPAFDDVTRLAAAFCRTPAAGFGLLDGEREWFKSVHGTDLRDLPRTHSFCARLHAHEGPLVVRDTTVDEGFRDHPLVLDGPRIRFWAGVPVRSPDGHLLGALSVTHQEPHSLDDGQVAALRMLAEHVGELLELRRREADARRVHSECEDAKEAAERRGVQLATSQTLAGMGTWEWALENGEVTWSAELRRIFGVDDAYRPGFEGYIERVHPLDRERVRRILEGALASGERVGFEERIVRGDGEVRVLRSAGEPLRDAGGAVRGMVGACLDVTEARRNEEGLRASERAYRTIVELASDAIFIQELETGRILDANRKATELHGYSLEELREGGVALLSADPPEVAEREALKRIRLAAEGEPQRFEWRGRHRSGALLWVEVGLQRVELPDGVRLIAISRDITERRAAQVALQEAHDDLERRVEERTDDLRRSNERLKAEVAARERAAEALRRRTTEMQAILAGLPDVYFRVGDDGRVRDWFVGSMPVDFDPPGGFLGRTVDELLSPDAAAVLGDAIERCRESGEIVCVDYRFHLGGRLRDFEARVSPLGNGEVVFIVRDITDRMDDERALRLQKALLEAQGEASIDGVLVVDDAGGILSWNRRFQELWGIPDEIVAERSDGRALGWVLDQLEDPEAFLSRVQYLYAHPDEDSRDELVLRDGRVLDRYSGPVRAPDGDLYGRIWWFRDITAHKRSEVALQQARESAERANRAKSEFLSRMSHELRTPLNSILGFAQLLERADLPETQRRSVDHILKGGRHLLALINEVLDIARIEANRQHFSLEPVRVRPLVEEALALVRPIAAQHGCRLEETDRVDDGLFVRADRQRLIQVLLNLLSNGVKYNRPGGSVALEVDLPAAGDGGEPRVRIAVRDTGAGIPPDRMDRLFTPFERLGAEQTGVEGTGLGLALSSRLVEAMGGRLGLESVPGAGSTFWVELPRAEAPTHAQPTRPRPTPDGPGRGLRRARLLYIEDNLANVSLVESILASRPDIRLLTALQGRMGLELAREHRPDLILLDQHLPDLPGHEVLLRLRADERTRDIPVVAISADATQSTIRRLRNAGVRSYLTKPLDIDAFLDAVEAALAGDREAVG